MPRQPYRTAPVPSPGMPPGIPYIVGNEAAERFSFYGMRTILVIFMTKYLWMMGDIPMEPMSGAAANEKGHLFVTAVYATPLLGALIADAFFGKYRTIVWLSLVYCMGHACLAFMGVTGSAGVWLFMGLALISMGSGGIKPCVSAHVGDQFGETNKHLITRIFNWFYWSINLGAFLSTLLTPWLLHWYGPHLAFGVPGILMGLATLIFWMGRWKFIHIPPKGTGFVKETFSIEGLAAMGKLVVIYVFVAMFWALFDQTMTSWVLQADDMNRRWMGVEWLPSQVQLINPLFILIFIPLFTYWVYPTIDRVFSLTPIRKISIGLFVMAAGFTIVSVSQEWIDAGQRPSIGWQVLAFALVTASEVMVSIVCLEFSYTQAPKAMKSWIMAMFLFSVSIGNLFTAGVNHFIQVPNTLVAVDQIAAKAIAVPGEADASSNTFTHRGFDNNFGTDDDVAVTYEGGQRKEVKFAGGDIIGPMVEKIQDYIRTNEWQVPDPETGSLLVSQANDPWGQPLRYSIVNSRQCRVTSLGPDKKYMTPWDQGVNIKIAIPEPPPSGGLVALIAQLRPETPWLSRRKAELGLSTEEATEEGGPQISVTRFVGGQTKLEGAPYFWFFTRLMLGTAFLFVVVARFYKPREYLHDEIEINEEEEIVEALS